MTLDRLLGSARPVIYQVLGRLHIAIGGCPEAEVPHRFRFRGDGKGLVVIRQFLYNRPIGFDAIHRHLLRFQRVHRDPAPLLELLDCIQQSLHTYTILC